MVSFSGRYFESLHSFEDFVKSSVFPYEYGTSKERIFYFKRDDNWHIAIHDITDPSDGHSKVDFSSIGCAFSIDGVTGEDMFFGEFPVRSVDESFRKCMVI